MSLIYTPHDYQYLFLADYLKWVDDSSIPTRLYTAPTGTGKSVMELMALDADPYALLVTTRLEIVAGMLVKMGTPQSEIDNWSTERLAREALARRITTPIRLRNMLARGNFINEYLEAYTTYVTKGYSGKGHVADWYKGSMNAVYRILFDEGHHVLADTYKDIKAYLPNAQIACFTATPFRGTPRQTDEFLAIFDNHVQQVLSLRQANERNLFTMPTCEIWPLVDDDTLTVVNGEIQVESASQAAGSVLADVVKRCQRFVTHRIEPRVIDLIDNPNTSGPIHEIHVWDRPTMFAVPSVDVAQELRNQLVNAGLPAERVWQETPRTVRNDLFNLCVNRELAIVQIDVVSEGVDLPICRLIDLRPTLSPVKWMQQFGRITRPTDVAPHYICTNRNLERHGYLLDGLLPVGKMAEAQQVFGNPSKRTGLRVVGLEGLGKFQGIELPLLGGLRGIMYNITAVEDHRRKDVVILCHPCSSTPIVAERQLVPDPAGDGWDWKSGNFRRIDSLPDLKGYGSATSKALSPKQQAWWARDAGRFGLDPNANVNRKNFACLPVLRDIGLQLKGG